MQLFPCSPTQIKPTILIAPHKKLFLPQLTKPIPSLNLIRFGLGLNGTYIKLVGNAWGVRFIFLMDEVHARSVSRFASLCQAKSCNGSLGICWNLHEL